MARTRNKGEHELVRIIIEKRSDGLFDVTRERKPGKGGERMAGAATLEDALAYVCVHLDLFGTEEPCEE